MAVPRTFSIIKPDATRRNLTGAVTKMLEDAGAFAVVLELVPREVAAMITSELTMSTIGIGAGLECDIQVLVLHDLVGMTFGRLPRFVRQYADIRQLMTDAIQSWSADVKTGQYPNDDESYGLTEDTLIELGAASAPVSNEG